MAAAIALAQRGRGRTGLNPSVGCIIVKDAHVIGRGWTQTGGRPHAEAMALAQANGEAKGATAYVTLEPCAHVSERGPTCAASLINAGVAHVVVATEDPDPRTSGKGIAALRQAGIAVESGVMAAEAQRGMAGYMMRQRAGRPLVTLKLATSLDGAIALANGASRWITGEAARRHAHLVRAVSDAILVGGGTYRADNPALDVRIAGLQDRAPEKWILTRGETPAGWQRIATPGEVGGMTANELLVEGGAQTAASFLRAGLVDRLLLYRAPILLGGGKPCLSDIGLESLDSAHRNWSLLDTRMLGADRMELYERVAAS